IVRLLNSAFRQAEIFVGIGDFDSKTLQLPAWIKSHLERQPALQKKLEQGELVGITMAEDSPLPRPATAARSSLVLIPVIGENRLAAAIGFVSPFDGPQLSAEDIEIARQFACDVAPILARLQDLERLQRDNQELLAHVRHSERTTDAILALIEQKDMLQATLQMRSHQQRNVAHELRTPLAAIRGYVRMILDGRGGEVNDTQKEYLRIVTENTNRLITLVS